MAYTLSTVLMLMVVSININSHNNEAYNQRLDSPTNEMKEVAKILSSNTVISKNTMMVHIFNTSITATAVVNSGVRTSKSTLAALR